VSSFQFSSRTGSHASGSVCGFVHDCHFRSLKLSTTVFP
jgi:hypothetical protein